MSAPRRESLDVTLRSVAVRHPMKVVSALLLLITGALMLTLARDDTFGGAQEAASTSSAAAGGPSEDAGVAVPTFEVLAKIEQKPVTTKKGRLLKEQMKKKLERGAGTGPGTSARGPTKGGDVALGGAPAVALAGDGELRRGLTRGLRGSARVVEEGAGSARWLASLSMTTGEAKGVIFAKCSAAMSELPARKLVGSLSTRADVSGDGMNDDELRSAAKESCATSLAEDVAQWLRARR